MGAMATSLELPVLQVWRPYRGVPIGENRIKGVFATFGLIASIWAVLATEAALGMAMLAYNLIF
jgi:hypothetical protein